MNRGIKNILSAALIGAACFLFWELDVYGYKEIGVYRNAIEQRQALLQSRQEILSKLSKAAIDYQQHKNDIQQLDAVVPNRRQIPELIVALETIAANSGVQLAGITLNEEQKLNIGTQAETDAALLPGDKINIGIDGKGTYPAFLTLLDNLERNIRVIDVQGFSVGVSGGQPNATINILQFTIQADARFIK